MVNELVDVARRKAKIGPKHLSAKKFVEAGLFCGLSHFRQLENRISNLPEHERGDAFEVFAEAYFATQKLAQATEVWPDKTIPISLLTNLRLPSKDMGADGIFRTKEDHYHAYQVKFRTGRTSLNWKELSTFMGLSDCVHERVLFTNSTGLPALMQDRTDFYAITGHNLDVLDENDFQCIEEWMKSGSFIFKRKDPRAHQEEALANLLFALSSGDRATAVMACGTGKTLISLWVAERMDIDTMLVLLPSLSLVQQTLSVWMKQTVWNDHSFLCVCSDQSVVKGLDEIVLHQSDLNFPVTTDYECVKRFLTGRSTRKLIFSTYHSSKVIAEGLPQGFSFDLGIFDEAHKTAGREGTNFSFALKNENISIKKRIFLTATPRHYNVNKRNKEGDPQLVFSMDNPEIYGSNSHKLSFASAASREIICKYKIVISVVTEDMISRELLKKGEVLVKGDVVKANQIARALAVKNATEKYGIKRIITFHSSVKAAKSFTSPEGEGVSIHLEGFETFHVNGEMSASQRTSIMCAFEEAPKALISNARCLTEGIDVPAVDMVAFMSPKKSHVDIVQAIGRAMRKPTGADKDYGYIFLPIFLETEKEENIEMALEDTQFQEIWDVLEAMQEQDECLAEIIRQIREDIGRKKGFDESRLRDKIEVLGPELSLVELQNAIMVKIIEKLGCSWDEQFGRLCAFKEVYGHCNVPSDYLKEFSLHRWVIKQRSRKNVLSQERINRLNAIGFDWDPLFTRWETMFVALLQYQAMHGDCNVPQEYPENPELGIWVSEQRLGKRDVLIQERRDRLNAIGFDWDPRSTRWETMFAALLQYKESHGDCNVPRGYLQNPAVSTWVSEQRTRKKQGRLSQERIDKLNVIGFDWDPLHTRWKAMFIALVQYQETHGDCNVPNEYPQNPSLGIWVERQRGKKRKGKLRQEYINELNAIGFDWEPGDIYWERMFASLLRYKEIHGDCNVSSTQDPILSSWVKTLRVSKKGSRLSQERIDRLTMIGFDWDPFHTRWKAGFAALVQYKETHGDCNVPNEYPQNPSLGMWVEGQRGKKRKGKLRQEYINELNAIGFDWDPVRTQWENMFAALLQYQAIHGDYNVPQKYPENPKLGAWVSWQRFRKKKGELAQEYIDKLNAVGFF